MYQQLFIMDNPLSNRTTKAPKSASIYGEPDRVHATRFPMLINTMSTPKKVTPTLKYKARPSAERSTTPSIALKRNWLRKSISNPDREDILNAVSLATMAITTTTQINTPTLNEITTVSVPLDNYTEDITKNTNSTQPKDDQYEITTEISKILTNPINDPLAVIKDALSENPTKHFQFSESTTISFSENIQEQNSTTETSSIDILNVTNSEEITEITIDSLPNQQSSGEDTNPENIQSQEAILESFLTSTIDILNVTPMSKLFIDTLPNTNTFETHSNPDTANTLENKSATTFQKFEEADAFTTSTDSTSHIDVRFFDNPTTVE